MYMLTYPNALNSFQLEKSSKYYKLEDRHCKNYSRKKFNNLEQAQLGCLKDIECAAIGSRGCGNASWYDFCKYGTDYESSNIGSCVYIKKGNRNIEELFSYDCLYFKYMDI